MDHAIWVSPDATKIVYATFNDSQVQNVQWKIYGDGRDASVNPYPKEAYMRYPKVRLYYVLFHGRLACTFTYFLFITLQRLITVHDIINVLLQTKENYSTFNSKKSKANT